MRASKVYLRSTATSGLDCIVREILDSELGACIPRGGRIVLKPNVNIPDPELAPAASTDPALVEAVARVVLERTPHLVVGDSDGMRFSFADSAAAMGLPDMARRLGFDLVNFSTMPGVEIGDPRTRGFRVPRPLLEADAVITLPVLKTHALTTFTGALKNQWGCVQARDRVLLHEHLHDLIVTVNEKIRPALAIMDAVICMEGRGPSSGKARRLDLVLASRDLVALDATAMRLVGLDVARARHVTLAARRGLGTTDSGHIHVDGPFEAHRCRFEPAELDWAIWLMDRCTRSRFFVHKVLMNDRIFWPARRAAQWLRGAGIVRGFNGLEKT